MKKYYFPCIATFLAILSMNSGANAESSHIDENVEEIDCTKYDWRSMETGNRFRSSDEIALFDNGVVGSYGGERGGDDIYDYRLCELSERERIIKVPVFLVDWEDFNPATDQSSPNNPDSIYDPEYSKLSVEEIEAFFQKENSPSEYFKDVSGGRLKFQFDVIGWIKGGTESSHLKARSEYLYERDNGNTYCYREDVFKDTILEAILNYGFDPTAYDINHTARDHSEGFLNGAVLMYEGGPATCSGINSSTLGIGSDATDSNGLKGINAYNLNRLESDNPDEQEMINSLNISLRKYVNIPESTVIKNQVAIWTHELGHAFIGYLDHYDQKYNVDLFGLSGSIHQVESPLHPAGFEKWLYAKWFEPKLITHSSIFTISAHEIADGSDYSVNETYLYKYNINDDPNHFLLIENRWLENEGNTLTKWANNVRDDNDLNSPLSGLQIIEVNKNLSRYGDEPNIYRHVSRNLELASQSSFFAWTEGSEFLQCEAQKCIKISSISAPGKVVTFEFSDFSDRDGDQVGDDEDAFPDDPSESLDTDKDGIGNNADNDDDGDSVQDEEDVFPLDSTEWLDSDDDLIGNNSDPDDDNDGFDDIVDAFPLDPTESSDYDLDGIGNNADIDDDNDGIEDDDDAFPQDETETVDTDADGIGNNADTDDDNDGVPDEQDSFPLDATRSSTSNNAGSNNSSSAESSGGGSINFSLLCGLLILLLSRKTVKRS